MPVKGTRWGKGRCEGSGVQEGFWEVAGEAHGGHPPSPHQVGQPGTLCLTVEDSSAVPLVVAGPEPQACTTAWSPAPGTSRDRLPGLSCSSEPITHHHAVPRPRCL